LRGTVPSRSEFKRCAIAKSIFVSSLVSSSSVILNWTSLSRFYD